MFAKHKNIAILLFFVLITGKLLSNQISFRLEIKNHSILFNDGHSVDAKLFSGISNNINCSELLIWQSTDTLNLKVVNLDIASHGFMSNNLFDLGIIAPGDSASITVSDFQPGIYRYFDATQSPYNEYLGLSGIIHIKNPQENTPYFYWDLREYQEEWNDQLNLGVFPNLLNYSPKYFTINGNSEPDINNDPIARVTGNVGQELKIVIVNNGLSIHSMHFHGYHAVLVNSSKNSSHVGRSKDTFPLYPSEYIVLSLTPDKPGEYPVHDHNLVAVTGGGIYHAGMFTTLLISP